MSNDSNVPPTERGLRHRDSWGSFWLSATGEPKSVWSSFGHMVWVWTERDRRGSLPRHRIGARRRRSDAGAPRVHDAHLQHGPLDPDPYAAAQAFARHPSRLQNVSSQPLKVINRVDRYHSPCSVSQKYIDQVAQSFRLFQTSSKQAPNNVPREDPPPPSSLTNPTPPPGRSGSIRGLLPPTLAPISAAELEQRLLPTAPSRFRLVVTEINQSMIGMVVLPWPSFYH